MSSGANSFIAIVPADPQNPAEIPTGDGEYVNFTSEDMGSGISSTQSNHIRPDRMTTDVTITGMEVSGGFSNELHFEQDADDKIIAAMLWASWQGIMDTGAVEISAENAVINASAGTIDMSGCTTIPNNIYHPGCMVRIKGAGDEANNGVRAWFYESSNVWRAEPPFAADETLAAGATADTQYVKNASEYHPFFIERGHVDVDEYFQFMGMAANTWTIEVPDQELCTNSYSFIGLTSNVVQTPTFSNYTGPSTNDSISSVTNIKEISLDGTPLQSCLVQSVSIEVNNNVAGNTGIGVFGACRTSPHKFEVTGALTMYFNSSEMYKKLLEGTEFSFAITFQDNDKNEYHIRMPRCKMSEDVINVESGDDEVLDNATYSALADQETEAQLIVYKFKA